MVMSNARLGMWLFIASDAATFAALLLSYLYLGISTPRGIQLSSGAIMTVVLLASSITMFLAVRTGRRMPYSALTALGGVLFLMLHLSEWRNLFREGVMHPPFFTITGAHMAHVAAGVICLSFARTRAGLEVVALYWYFVDAVWLWIFCLLYLV
jgi:cytochrome c oxidase subunit III